MDPTELYPNGFHPVYIDRNRNFKGKAKCYTRTEKPPKYFIIDFGLSKYYDPKKGPPREGVIFGGDKSVPEFQGDGVKNFHDPFPTDIYYTGNVIRQRFLQVGELVSSLEAIIEKNSSRICEGSSFCLPSLIKW